VSAQVTVEGESERPGWEEKMEELERSTGQEALEENKRGFWLERRHLRDQYRVSGSGG